MKVSSPPPSPTDRDPANYPETLKAAYVLNASPVFQLVFRIVKVGRNSGAERMQLLVVERGGAENPGQDPSVWQQWLEGGEDKESIYTQGSFIQP